MPTARGPARVAVKIDPDVWREKSSDWTRDRPPASRRSASGASSRKRGVALAQLQRCDDVGEDQTRLPGLVKVYVPITEAAPSERPYGMVFSPEPGPLLVFVAFGERHPRPGTRSVYERAHKRLHGRYPDQ